MKRFSQEFKQEVLNTIASGKMTVAQATRHYKLGSSTINYWRAQQTKKAAKKRAEEIHSEALEAYYPELPENLDVRKAISIYTACEQAGFDSPEAALICRQKGIKHEELLAIRDWIKQCDASNAFFECLALGEEVKRLQNLLEGRDVQIDEMQNMLDKRDRSLAELATEIILAKKAWAILK